MSTAPADPHAPVPTPFHLVAGDQVSPAALHQAFREAFADYLIGPFEVALDQWPGFMARQGAALDLSRVAVDANGEPLAFALVAPRPRHQRWRLATMGARPQARGTGAAAALLDDVIARAAQAGQRAVELEVFAQNERARRLYEGRGFQAVHTLHGWQLPLEEVAPSPEDPTPVASTPAALPQVVDRLQALAWLDDAEQRWPDLPLQVTRASLEHLAAPQAWRCGSAQLVFSLTEESVMVNSLVAPDPGDARVLLQALAVAHPQRQLRVPQLQRADLGGDALRDLGAASLLLHQLWMWRPLSA